MSILMKYFGMPYRLLPRDVTRWLDSGLSLAPWNWTETALPPVNVHESNEAVVMRFEVPGVAREDIDLTTTDTSVTVKVKRPVEGEIPPERYHVRERWRGEFGRTVTVPAKVDSSKATAAYQNGVLTVTLPKREEVKARRIAVQAE